MVKFTFKCLLLAVAFFFGVLYGMQQSDNSQVQKNANIDHLIQIEQTQENTLSTGNIVSDREPQSPNAYSTVGNTVSKAVTGLFRGGVTAVSSIIEYLLNDTTP